MSIAVLVGDAALMFVGDEEVDEAKYRDKALSVVDVLVIELGQASAVAQSATHASQDSMATSLSM